MSQLQMDQAAINKLQIKLSTGQSFQRPSENPAAAIRILALQRQQENQKQSLVNLSSANSNLSVTETSLANLTSTLTQVKGLALEAVTNLNSDSDRQSWRYNSMTN